MIRTVIALALLAASTMAWAQSPAGQPLVRTKLVPTEGVVVGQPVRLDVEVLFPGDMPHPPLVNMPEARGAQIMRFETQAITIRDRIDGQDYVGKSFEFILFPRRGGEMAIPAPHITLLDHSGDPVGAAEGQATRLDITVPAGIDPSGPVLVSDAVSVAQSWSPDPGAAPVKAGDAITRTIRRRADGVPALGMAEFKYAAPEGVRVYVDPPAVEDRTNRGNVEGQRIDKVTYVFEKAGRYQLPALAQPWWDLADQQARQEELPGVTVTVAASPAPGSKARPTWQSSWLSTGVAVLISLGLVTLLAGPLTDFCRRMVADLRASEAFARRRLQAAARSGSAEATYRALTLWRKRLAPGEAGHLRGDPALAPLLAGLEQAVFGDGKRWGREQGAVLARALGRWRSRRPASPVQAGLLPALNPAAGEPPL